eukprot:TRINITY_DN67334_c6_g1_i1.p2 TRINITY_DN67334_c6_g1~~TRINITY_DN67334_c6_g1_i1.p2  ORF type:complete len:720 (+),score=363.14 TRINITY_DN67334_c6_g1_i1:58-2160(+)
MHRVLLVVVAVALVASSTASSLHPVDSTVERLLNEKNLRIDATKTVSLDEIESMYADEWQAFLQLSESKKAGGAGLSLSSKGSGSEGSTSAKKPQQKQQQQHHEGSSSSHGKPQHPQQHQEHSKNIQALRTQFIHGKGHAKCSDGTLCPIKGGTCCGNGHVCCPSSHPCQPTSPPSCGTHAMTQALKLAAAKAEEEAAKTVEHEHAMKRGSESGQKQIEEEKIKAETKKQIRAHSEKIEQQQKQYANQHEQRLKKHENFVEENSKRHRKKIEEQAKQHEDAHKAHRLRLRVENREKAEKEHHKKRVQEEQHKANERKSKAKKAEQHQKEAARKVVIEKRKKRAAEHHSKVVAARERHHKAVARARAAHAHEHHLKQVKRQAEQRHKARTRVRFMRRWRNYGGSYRVARVDMAGPLCVVSGLARRGSGRGYIARLPGACRPRWQVIIDTHSGSGWPQRVDVNVHGGVHWSTGRGGVGWLSLTNIAFIRRGQRMSRLSLASGWGQYSRWWGPVGWTKWGDFCQLQGLVRTRYRNWNRRPIARLPRQCWPQNRLIFNGNHHTDTVRVDVLRNGYVYWVHKGHPRHYPWRWVSLSGIGFFQHNGHPLRLRGGWRPYGSSYRRPSWKKQGNLCVVSGLARAGNWRATIAVLPSTCRPSGRLIFMVNNHGARASRVDVLRNGRIVWTGAGHAHGWVSLDGIRFVPH